LYNKLKLKNFIFYFVPTYEYVCSKCKKHFEVWQRITDKPVSRCTRKGCRGGVRRTIAGGGGFIFKGTGFYVTDYKKAAPPKKEEKGLSDFSKASIDPKAAQGKKEKGKGPQ